MVKQWWEKLQRLFAPAGSGKVTADGALTPSAPPPRVKEKNPLGERGENVAARHLQKLGYRILQRNFKTPMGEIDIIARDGKTRTLVFCEVKTRAADEPTPEQQVNADKMHQLTKAAKFYLSRYGQSPPPARFDVIAIVWPHGREPSLRHTESAFEPTF